MGLTLPKYNEPVACLNLIHLELYSLAEKSR